MPKQPKNQKTKKPKNQTPKRLNNQTTKQPKKYLAFPGLFSNSGFAEVTLARKSPNKYLAFPSLIRNFAARNKNKL